METFECISQRASVRQYNLNPIDRNILEKLVDAGMRAPTARAVEPWEFVVVTAKDTLKTLGQIASPTGLFLKDAQACIAVFCQDTKYFLEDGCAATENILLAAADSGLGACWIAGDKKSYTAEVSRLLKVPESFKLISLIALGWPAKKVNQHKKRNLTEVIHWEVFD